MPDHLLQLVVAIRQGAQSWRRCVPVPRHRAKTASDIGDLSHSQRQLGHRNREMTEHYVRERISQRVKPRR